LCAMPLLKVNDRYTRRLAKRDQSAAMLTPNYFLYPHQKFTKDGLYHEYIVDGVNFQTNC